LQCVAVCCSVLQCVAVCNSVLQYDAEFRLCIIRCSMSQCLQESKTRGRDSHLECIYVYIYTGI